LINAAVIALNFKISIRFGCLFHTGCVAVRETMDGTWFIQEFCKELENNGEMEDLLTLLTNVNRRVAVNKVVGEGYQKVKQMPVVQSTLTRKLFFSSTMIRSRITVTPDVTSLLGKTNEKLDYITRMLEHRKTSLSVPKVKQTRKQSSPLSWDSLQSSKQTMTNPVPQGEAVYKLAEALKMFLEDEGHRLEPSQKENGEFILNYLSCWENLNEDLKWCGYKNMVIFLKEHAKNWKVYKLLDFPDSSMGSGQQCHQRGSLIDVPDASSFGHRPSTISRRIPTTSRSNIRN
jgi:Caspase domain.